MDPVTMAMIGAQVIGHLLEGITGFISGNAQGKLQDAQARTARQEGAVQGNVALDEGERVAGESAVRLASDGAGTGSSGFDVIADTQRTAMFNARSAIWAGNNEAAVDHYNAQMSRKKATFALIGGVVQAGSSLASGFARDAETRRQASARQELRGYRGSNG